MVQLLGMKKLSGEQFPPVSKLKVEPLPGCKLRSLNQDSTAGPGPPAETPPTSSKGRARCAREEWLKRHLQPESLGDEGTTFRPGMTLESIGNVIMRETEELQSKRVKLLPASSKVEVLSISSKSERRMHVRDADGVDGWVSIRKESDEELWALIPPITAGCKLYSKEDELRCCLAWIDRYIIFLPVLETSKPTKAALLGFEGSTKKASTTLSPGMSFATCGEVSTCLLQAPRCRTRVTRWCLSV